MIDTETTDAVMTNTESKQRLTGITDGMGRVPEIWPAALRCACTGRDSGS